MEHGVYICGWSRSLDGWTLWVKSRPHLRAKAPTLAEAENRLIEAIQDAGGAMHAVMEFDPALPRTPLEEKYCHPEIYMICGDERFETDSPKGRSFEAEQEKEVRRRWLDTFYEHPVCRKCKQTSGRRNEKPITLTFAPSRYDGAFGSIGSDGGPSHFIFSESFLDLLTQDEANSLQFQQTTRRRGRRFFELVGPEGPPYVAVAGLQTSGWRCTECGYRTWGYWVEGMSITSFVSRSDLPTVSCGLFTVGTFPEIALATRAHRWGELRGRKGTRGFTSRLLGVVPDEEVVRRPELLTYEERLSKKDH